METRRIRRLERRRTRRIALAIISLAGLSMAIGLALPRNTFASVLLSSAAIAVLLVIVVRGDAVAPTHGLRHVVRLPMQSAASATLESLWSRFTGTVRALSRAFVRTLPRSTPVPLDPNEELDDEAGAWWGSPRECLTTTDIEDCGVDDRGAENVDEASFAPDPTPRMDGGWHRRLMGTRRLFTRSKGQPNAAGDAPSGDVVEAGTLSTRST